MYKAVLRLVSFSKVLVLCIFCALLFPIKASSSVLLNQSVLLHDAKLAPNLNCHFIQGKTPDFPDLPKPILSDAFPNRYTGAKASELSAQHDYASEFFMEWGAAALVREDAANTFKQVLLKWVEQDALPIKQVLKRGSNNKTHAIFYFSQVTLLSITVNYAHNKAVFSSQERSLVENWIASRIDTIASTPWVQEVDLDNKKYLFGSLQMAFGIAVGDEERFDYGVDVYKRAISGLRDDGSLVTDSERWGSAIHYSNAAITSLVTIAQMAHNQGVDLYSFKKNGKSLDLAISFLLDATDNPSVIYQYAKLGRHTGSFRGFTASNQKNDWFNEHAQWAYFYSTRFPNSALTKRMRLMIPLLRDGLPEDYLHHFNKLMGGSVSCLAIDGSGRVIEDAEDDLPKKPKKPEYDRTKSGLSMRFDCLKAALSEVEKTTFPPDKAIDDLIDGLEGNKHYRTKRHLVKLGLSEKAVKAHKVALLRLVNFEGTNEAFCAKPLR